MSEEQIRTAEEQLHELINESREFLTKGNSVLTKLKKSLNIFLFVAIPMIVMFFYSFVDVRIRMSSLEETKISKVDADAKYPTKASVIFFQNDLYDMNNIVYQYNNGMTESRMESIYTKAQKSFMGDVSRGTGNQQ